MTIRAKKLNEHTHTSRELKAIPRRKTFGHMRECSIPVTLNAPEGRDRSNIRRERNAISICRCDDYLGECAGKVENDPKS